MKTLQLRDAKAQLSALVDAAERGEPTTITRHGKPAAMVVSIEAARKIYPEKKPNLVEWLMAMPADIPWERNQTPPRKVEF